MCEKRIIDCLADLKKPSLSLEFFPPKDLVGFGVLGASIERMKPLSPDFVSCTYGAGGSTRDFSFSAWELLQRMGFMPVIAHLTCVGSSRSELTEIIHRIYAMGIRNIMALRGDPPRGQVHFTPPADGLPYARDLVELIHTLHPDICCGVAGYPETHPDAASPEADIHYLKQKVAAGTGFITTQLFFDNAVYYRFVADCRAAGITVPILPGLMPVRNLVQLERSVEFSCATIPAAFRAAMERAADPGAVGLDWAAAQIKDLLANGAPGIHLYILNRAQMLLEPKLRDALGR